MDETATARAPGGTTLIVQPLPGIGDMIWHLPHIHAIAKAVEDRKVSLLVKPRTQADRLLSADPAIDKVLWLQRNPGEHDGLAGIIRLSRLLAAGEFGTVWVFHGSWRYPLAARLAGIPRRIGFGTGLQKRFLAGGSALPARLRRGHPIEQVATLLDLNDVPLADQEPQLPVDKEAGARIRKRFSHAPEPWIALGLGSSEPFKQWGRERFGALAARIADRGVGSVFLIGGPGEQEMAGWIVDHVRADGGAVENAVGSSIEDSVALTAACRAFVGNDSGFLNVAAAVAVDAIGLFGGSRPLTYSRRIHCVLPDEASAGMDGIGVDRVLAALDRLSAG